MVKCSLSEIKSLIVELEAYRSIQKEPFDFGNGLIFNESQTSEDVYWKMELWELKDILEEYYELKYISNNFHDSQEKQKKIRPNRHARKLETQRRLKKSYVYYYNCGICYDENKNRYYRWYLTGPRKYAKWCTNRVIRAGNKEFSHKCGGYRKVFDYWWTVF